MEVAANTAFRHILQRRIENAALSVLNLCTLKEKDNTDYLLYSLGHSLGDRWVEAADTSINRIGIIDSLVLSETVILSRFIPSLYSSYLNVNLKLQSNLQLDRNRILVLCGLLRAISSTILKLGEIVQKDNVSFIRIYFDSFCALSSCIRPLIDTIIRTLFLELYIKFVNEIADTSISLIKLPEILKESRRYAETGPLLYLIINEMANCTYSLTHTSSILFGNDEEEEEKEDKNSSNRGLLIKKSEIKYSTNNPLKHFNSQRLKSSLYHDRNRYYTPARDTPEFYDIILILIKEFSHTYSTTIGPSVILIGSDLLQFATLGDLSHSNPFDMLNKPSENISYSIYTIVEMCLRDSIKNNKKFMDFIGNLNSNPNLANEPPHIIVTKSVDNYIKTKAHKSSISLKSTIPLELSNPLYLLGRNLDTSSKLIAEGVSLSYQFHSSALSVILDNSWGTIRALSQIYGRHTSSIKSNNLLLDNVERVLIYSGTALCYSFSNLLQKKMDETSNTDVNNYDSVDYETLGRIIDKLNPEFLHLCFANLLGNYNELSPFVLKWFGTNGFPQYERAIIKCRTIFLNGIFKKYSNYTPPIIDNGYGSLIGRFLNVFDSFSNSSINLTKMQFGKIDIVLCKFVDYITTPMEFDGIEKLEKSVKDNNDLNKAGYLFYKSLLYRELLVSPEKTFCAKCFTFRETSRIDEYSYNSKKRRLNGFAERIERTISELYDLDKSVNTGEFKTDLKQKDNTYTAISEIFHALTVRYILAQIIVILQSDSQSKESKDKTIREPLLKMIEWYSSLIFIDLKNSLNKTNSGSYEDGIKIINNQIQIINWAINSIVKCTSKSDSGVSYDDVIDSQKIFKFVDTNSDLSSSNTSNISISEDTINNITKAIQNELNNLSSNKSLSFAESIVNICVTNLILNIDNYFIEEKSAKPHILKESSKNQSRAEEVFEFLRTRLEKEKQEIQLVNAIPNNTINSTNVDDNVLRQTVALRSLVKTLSSLVHVIPISQLHSLLYHLERIILGMVSGKVIYYSDLSESMNDPIFLANESQGGFQSKRAIRKMLKQQGYINYIDTVSKVYDSQGLLNIVEGSDCQSIGYEYKQGHSNLSGTVVGMNSLDDICKIIHHDGQKSYFDFASREVLVRFYLELEFKCKMIESEQEWTYGFSNAELESKPEYEHNNLDINAPKAKL